jgi:hypothetical protein
MNHIPLVVGLTMAGVGLVCGLVYFSILRRTAVLLSSGQGRFTPLALTLGRLALATFVLASAARMGAVPLLAAFAGFLLARALALRSPRRSG